MTETVHQKYWRECISNAADECRATLTADQVNAIAEAVEGCHDNYGMAFYSPPPTDRLNEIEREGKRKVDDLQRQFDSYRSGAERAIKSALRQHSDAKVEIKSDGSVFRYDGRIEQIA